MCKYLVQRMYAFNDYQLIAPYGSYPFSEYLLSGHKVKSRQVYSLSGQQILHVLIEQVYVKSFYIFIIPFAVLIQRRIGPFNKIVVGPHI